MPQYVFPILCALMQVACVSGIAYAQATTLVPRAHAHNDYLHDRPLFDALSQGFGSVEADIFLVDGELLVGHARNELTSERTLRGLYLEPLRERISQHGGRVYPGLPEFTLLIDIKSEAESTYQALQTLLVAYADMLTRVVDGKTYAGPVRIVISGNRPIEAIANSSPRFVGIDGRLSDLESQAAADLLPLISDNWSQHFKWRGQGEMPVEERQKLAEIVRQVHAKQRRLRFWATPDTPAMWSVLETAGADLINTDDLAGLASFLRK